MGSHERTSTWVRFHTLLAVLRILVAVPVGFFGLLIFFSVFGDGSRLVGGLLMLAAVSGPVVHGAIARAGTRPAREARAWALHGTLGLWLVDALAAGVFLVPALRGGGLVYAVPFALVALVHATGVYLAVRSRQAPVEDRPPG